MNPVRVAEANAGTDLGGKCQPMRETTGRPGRAAVWNDMFDPFHNAVKGPYYLVNGPWSGSWEGLSKDVLVMNWNHGKRDQSLKFFADRGQ